MPDQYNYETAGFDGFLSRSIDGVPQQNLGEQGPRNLQQRYDDTQISGFFGDILQIGPVRITPRGIEMVDDNDNVVLLIGEEDS